MRAGGRHAPAVSVWTISWPGRAGRSCSKTRRCPACSPSWRGGTTSTSRPPTAPSTTSGSRSPSALPRPTTPCRRWPGCSMCALHGPVGRSGSFPSSTTIGAPGTPLAGVNVIAVGTSFSATTDSGGRYAIAGVPVGTYHLRARSLGYTPGDTTVVVREGQETVADFRLQRSPIELNPIVAIGYGTSLKHDLTGAVSSVTADQFETKAAPTITLSSGLQGKAAGVQVTSNTGLPGGGLRVRVRGTGSITANSEPLYVIDGLPAEQGTSS